MSYPKLRFASAGTGREPGSMGWRVVRALGGSVGRSLCSGRGIVNVRCKASRCSRSSSPEQKRIPLPRQPGGRTCVVNSRYHTRFRDLTTSLNQCVGSIGDLDTNMFQELHLRHRHQACQTSWQKFPSLVSREKSFREL